MCRLLCKHFPSVYLSLLHAWPYNSSRIACWLPSRMAAIDLLEPAALTDNFLGIGCGVERMAWGVHVREVKDAGGCWP